MTQPDTFSQRYGPRREFVSYDEVPGEAKAQLARIVRHRADLRSRYNYDILLPSVDRVHEELALAVARDPVARVMTSPDDPDYETHFDEAHLTGIGHLVRDCEWWEFYQVCETLMDLAISNEATKRLGREIERLLRGFALPYQVRRRKVVRRFTNLAEQQISQALRLLALDQRFKGPAQQFSKAVEHLNKRPPDMQNCVQDAVKALEGLARVLCNRPKGTLGALARPLAQQLQSHGALAQAISSLYGYASDAQGIRHGATAPLKGTAEEAELVLHWCAASIVYLIRKHDALQRKSPPAVSPAGSPR